MNGPFEFKQTIMLLKATGKKAASLTELRDIISSVSPDSIVHHTYHYFLKGHILEYTNDFSHWAGESIEERALSEQLSNVDPYDYRDVEHLRKELLRVIDDYREQFPEPRQALPRDEFFFNEAVTLVFPAGLRAQNLAEFLMAVKHVDASSLYYHFYDSRKRQEGGKDDFSQWFEQELGKVGLARKIHSIDPFMHRLEGIRELIAQAVEDEVRMDMQSAGIKP
jgi:hypothetical protein